MRLSRNLTITLSTLFIVSLTNAHSNPSLSIIALSQMGSKIAPSVSNMLALDNMETIGLNKYVHRQLLSCDTGCEECPGGPSLCTVCQAGYQFLPSTTNSPTGSCPCRDGTYPDTGTCKQCPGLCTKCDDASTCTECAPNMYKHNDQCLLTCPTGTINDQTNLICLTVTQPTITQPASDFEVEVTRYDTLPPVDFTYSNVYSSNVTLTAKLEVFYGDSAIDLSRNIKWISISNTVDTTNKKVQLMIGSNDYPVPETYVKGVTDTYTVRVTFFNNAVQNASREIILLHTSNRPPTIKAGFETVAQRTTSFKIGSSTKRQDIPIATYFTDLDSDTLSVSCRPVSLDLQSNGGNAYQSGSNIRLDVDFPHDNKWAGIYEYSCIVEDGTDSNEYTFYIEMLKNLPPTVVATLSNVTLLERDPSGDAFHTFDLDDLCEDADSSSLSLMLYINGVEYSALDYATDISYDLVSHVFTFDYQHKINAGFYEILMTCSDSINYPSTYAYYNIEAIPNSEPYWEKEIPQYNISIFDFQLGNKYIEVSEFFVDPEDSLSTNSDAYTIDISGGLDTQKFTFSRTTGRLTLKTTLSSNQWANQEYEFTVTIKDNIGQIASALLNVYIQGCAEGCQNCAGLESFQCQNCYSGFFFFESTCVTSCENGYYGDSDQRNCASCHSTCTTCSGGSNYDCSSCANGFFMQEDGSGDQYCTKNCRRGYYPSLLTNKCELIDEENYPKYTKCLEFVENNNLYLSTNPDVPDGYDQEIVEISDLNGQPVSIQRSAFQRCAGYLSGQNCIWNRKFSMQCFINDNGDTIIRVATNSLPPHSYYGYYAIPAEYSIDFEVLFNPDVEYMSKLNMTSPTVATSYLCSDYYIADKFIPSTYGFKSRYLDNEGAFTTETIVGIAMNGVPIKQGTTEEGYDPFFPQAYSSMNNAQNSGIDDQCYGYFEGSEGNNGSPVNNAGFYHYYSYSPCIKELPSTTQLFDQCFKDDTSCLTDESNIETAFSQLDTLEVIGIAKDGHIIISPLNSAGGFYQPCEMDACNGITIEGQYYYVASVFHPYTVGCWGPARQLKVKQACSANTNICVVKLNSSASTTMFNIFVAMVSIVMVFSNFI
eukprot:403365514